MNWEDARYFLALARAGKINRAAENLGISPITLSRRMAHLQDQMRITLFTRHNQGIALTQDGQKFFETLERAELEFETVNDRYSRDKQTLEGTLRIAAPEGFALKILSPALAIFIDKNPALHIELVPLPRGFSLSKREADLAIMVERPAELNLHYEELGTYRLGLYAAQSYLEKHGRPASRAELAQHRLIGYVDDLLSSERINTPRAAWSLWQSQIAIYSPIGQLEAVKAGAGIGVLHQFLLDDQMELLRVLPEIELTRSFYIVTHKNLAKSSSIRTAIEFLKSINIYKI